MTGKDELITVYRSADNNAEQDALAIQDRLQRAGFHPEIFDDSSPGVVEGAYEVRVPRSEVPGAEEVIGDRAVMDDPEPGDPTHSLDLVTVARTDGTTAEMEATAIKGILDANGIPAVIVGNSTLPNFGFEVQVPQEYVAMAEAAIAEARAAGPAAAAEAEKATEQQA
jgi:hypothetical protein